MHVHLKSALPALLMATALSAGAGAQGIQYDKIEIKTDKLAPNLYMLSGSENVDPGHPDGAGGRIGVLAGPDGIFMVDSQYQQIGDRVLAAVRQHRSGSDPLPRQHAHSRRPHRGQRDVREAGRGAARARGAARGDGAPAADDAAGAAAGSGETSGR